jgi:diguanylate cyclase (GGDEF)-like protein
MATNPAVQPQPFSREALFRQIGPLAGAVMMWLLYVLAPKVAEGRSTDVIRGATLLGTTVVLTVSLPWRRLPEFLKVAPPLIYLWAVFQLPEFSHGQVAVGTAFVLLPVFWLALYGTRTEVLVGVCAVAAGLFGPMVAAWNVEIDWGYRALIAIAAAALGFSIQYVFAHIRLRAERAHLLSGIDALTGLPNRRAWDERASRLLSQAGEARVPACVAVLDLDHFQRFNETHGRQEGDRVLVGTTMAWRNHIRQTDMVARVGDDEFAVMLVGCSLEAASGIARRLSGLVDAPITASAGIAEWNVAETAAELVARAKEALARAKSEGRARVEFAHAASPTRT